MPFTSSICDYNEEVDYNLNGSYNGECEQQELVPVESLIRFLGRSAERRKLPVKKNTFVCDIEIEVFGIIFYDKIGNEIEIFDNRDFYSSPVHYKCEEDLDKSPDFFVEAIKVISFGKELDQIYFEIEEIIKETRKEDSKFIVDSIEKLTPGQIVFEGVEEDREPFEILVEDLEFMEIFSPPKPNNYKKNK